MSYNYLILWVARSTCWFIVVDLILMGGVESKLREFSGLYTLYILENVGFYVSPRVMLYRTVRVSKETEEEDDVFLALNLSCQHTQSTPWSFDVEIEHTIVNANSSGDQKDFVCFRHY